MNFRLGATPPNPENRVSSSVSLNDDRACSPTAPTFEFPPRIESSNSSIFPSAARPRTSSNCPRSRIARGVSRLGLGVFETEGHGVDVEILFPSVWVFCSLLSFVCSFLRDRFVWLPANGTVSWLFRRGDFRKKIIDTGRLIPRFFFHRISCTISNSRHFFLSLWMDFFSFSLDWFLKKETVTSIN